MIYAFEQRAGDSRLSLKGELYKYLIKARRHCIGDELSFRNKENIETLYKYRIIEIEPRLVHLELLDSKNHAVKSHKELHIAWCIIDSKSIEKVLASLCEIGVSKISFISCERSQKNFKPDFKRYERIVEASMQQSGRTSFMEFDTYKNIQSFIKQFPDTKVFDFAQKILDEQCDFKRVLIGCEGGFSLTEKEMLETQEIFRLNSPMILRSESAVMAVASKVLL